MMASFAGDMAILHWDDFVPGRTFTLGAVQVPRDEIQSFAGRWDPQEFHLRPTAAGAVGHADIIASGWHTVCLCSRLLVVRLMLKARNLPGPAVKSIRWPNAVYPDDTLTVSFHVISQRPSRSKSDRGLVLGRLQAVNQNGEDVLLLMLTCILLRQRTGDLPGSAAGSATRNAGP